MRSLTFTILAVVVAAGAQTPKPVTPAPKTATTKASTAPAKTPAKAMPAPKTPAKAALPAPKTVAKTTTPAPKTAPAKSTTAKTHVAAKPVVKTPVQKPAAKPTAAVQKPAEKAIPEVARANRRDPFISPLRLAEERMRTNPACTTGARCLVISQVTLKGVVKTQSGWIAMVENAARKQYNLHEKDTVQNGVVVKITGDSIVFQETVNDPLGRPVTREVVKRVTAPVV
jgi:Tfp pilus assembly protein PilP